MDEQPPRASNLNPEKRCESIGAKLQPLSTISARSLIEADLTEREMILSPWLPEQGLAMIFGARGIGKSHVVLGCAWAIASGGSFLRWKAPKPNNVLIIDGEMPQKALQARLKILESLNASRPPENLSFLSMDMQERGLDISNPRHQNELEPLLADSKVIIIDNLSTLVTGGKENESESWLPMQQWLLFQRQSGRSVIFVHHAGKSGEQRGTSRHEDVLDTSICLKHPTDRNAGEGARFIVEFRKTRNIFGDDIKPFDATLGAGGWTMKDAADEDAEIVIGLTESGMSVREIEAQTGIPKSRVNRIQQEARASGSLQKKAG